MIFFFNSHIFAFVSYRSFMGLLKQQNDQLPVGLLVQLEERALHQYRRGHGFQPDTNLKFFQAFNCLNWVLLKQFLL